MMTARSPCFSFVRYTSCSGCQLMLLNLENDLDLLFGLVRSAGFQMASSEPEPMQGLDLALVEGSITTTRELEHLLKLRNASKTLVAVGQCALTGGVNALASPDRVVAHNDVYGAEKGPVSTFHPQALHHFVHVDASICGCPPERNDLINLIATLLRGGHPGRQEMPVCMECRIAENRCLLIEEKKPCLGPVTRSGCKARCPGVGIGCEGCRGHVAEANLPEMVHLLKELGFSEKMAERRLCRFGSA